MLYTAQSTQTLASMNSSRKVLGIFGGNDIGNSIDKAKDAGLLKKKTGVFKSSGDVGGKDLDFYKFKLDKTTKFSARLENQDQKNDKDPISFSIVTSKGAVVTGLDGKSLFKNNIPAGKTDFISTRLPAGTYYARLESSKGSDQNYKFRLAASALS
jgi:hypothetical protein